MTFRSMSFPVQLGSEQNSLTLAVRSAISDRLRGILRTKLDAALSVGASKEQVIQQFAMNYGSAARGSRLLKGFPTTALNWVATVEYKDGTADYPVARSGSIGTFDRRSVNVLPGNVALIRFGGVDATGVLPEPPAMHELAEVRLTDTGLDGADRYMATLVFGSDNGDRNDAEAPVDLEPELLGEDR